MQLSLDYADLPEYRIRISGRAKRPSVTVCLHEGIVVTVPSRFDQRRLPALLREWQPWLTRQLATLQTQQRALPADLQQQRPTFIRLPAVGEYRSVGYQRSDRARVATREAGNRLTLHGATDDDPACREALRRWLARRARQHLEPLAGDLARTHGFSFKKISIRGQRTRWGSCSSTGTISLNYYLMFLEPELVQCVVLHELCHTRHMNHGPRFHALLDKLVPNHRKLDRQVNEGWKQIPAWAWRR